MNLLSIRLRFRTRAMKGQESSAIARKPRDAVAVLCGLKFADDTHYKFNSRN